MKMKRLFMIVVLFVMTMTTACAQFIELPFDTTVRKGVLPNGLTYYIRHNSMPENRADFYIAQKVGSVLEDENQRGLAHFLEHMAFNGTKNFPDMELRNYLQRNGVAFGENLNAATGFDQTVYLITNVPTTNPNLVDSCMLILHDWSSFISLEGDAIDNERGVILEEKRSRDGADYRMFDKYLPILYPTTPYAYRMPIGTEEVLKNFTYQDIRDYYHKWYRPDLQGIIIVGDIDADKIEARLKEMFSDITLDENVAERPNFVEADNEEPIVAVATDPEATDYSLYIFMKHEAFPKEYKQTLQYFQFDLAKSLVVEMCNDRLQDIAQNPQCPFVFSYGYDGNYYISQGNDAWQNYARPKDASKVLPTVELLGHECQRMKMGFTETELERAKTNLLKEYQNLYDNRTTMKNNQFVQRYLSNFLQGECATDVETEYKLASAIIPQLPLEMVNELAKEYIIEKNIVMLLCAPEIEGQTVPTEKEMTETFMKALTKDVVEPYKEEVIDAQLVEKVGKPGKVKKTTTNDAFGATTITLSNGIDITYKTTKFKENEVKMSAYRKGGMTTVDSDNIISILCADDLGTVGGLGKFSQNELRKVLTGKTVRVNARINSYDEVFSGQCVPADLETMFQLIYLNITDPREDQEQFERYKQTLNTYFANWDLNPDLVYHDSVTYGLYGNNPLARNLKQQDIEKIDYAESMKIYKDIFSNPRDFSFYFVGNFNPDTLKMYCEKYLGSIKTKKHKVKQHRDKFFTNANVDCRYEKEMSSPKTSVTLVYNTDVKYSYADAVKMSVLGDIMDLIYTQKIREDEGGTYGVSVASTMRKVNDHEFCYLYIVFETNAEAYEKLLGIAVKELQNVAENGPSETDLRKTIENKLKKRAEQLETNEFWLSAIQTYNEENEDILTTYEDIVKNITAQDIADMAKVVLNGYTKEIIQIGVNK